MKNLKVRNKYIHTLDEVFQKAFSVTYAENYAFDEEAKKRMNDCLEEVSKRLKTEVKGLKILYQSE